MKTLNNRFVQAVATLGVVATLALITPRAAHAVAAALVEVANTSANPVPNRDVDAAGRHPFALQCSASGGDTECFFPVVPANTEWVIQTVTVVLQAGTVPAPPSYGVLQSAVGGPAVNVANFPVVNSGGQFGTATQSLTAYASPGTTPACAIETQVFLPNSVFSCAISGYTVSLP